MTVIARDQLIALCREALTGAGAGEQDAQALADATAQAEAVGNRAVGVGHLFDYLDGYRQGRIAAAARPVVTRRSVALIDVDADGGLAQTAFAAAVDHLEQGAREVGLAALWIRNSYTCGELGWYPRRLAAAGLLAVAAANSPALMSLGGAPHPVLGTNPLAYGLPRTGRPPVVIDQASSSTAYVTIRRAAETGSSIPAGWAVGPDGAPTEDPADALLGALLPFGGHRGGNIALLVEVLATLSGANFSLDAPPFQHGDRSPGIGVFVLAIDPDRFPGARERLAAHLQHLHDDHRVRLPAMDLEPDLEPVTVDDATLQRLHEAVALAAGTT